MKWVYWHKTSPWAENKIRTWKEQLKRFRNPESHLNPQSSTWAFALEADVTSGWKDIEENIEKYDGVLFEYINFGDSQQNPLGKMRVELCRKHNPNIIMVGSWDSWCSRPRNVLTTYRNNNDFQWRKYAVDNCDLIFTTSNAWETRGSGEQMMWNNLFNTDKFTCLLAPFDIEYLSKFHKSYEEREKHIISSSPVNYHQTSSYSADVLKGCLPSGWKAGLTHTRKRPVPSPFYKMGVLDWWDYVEWISKSYLGVFNAVGGGLASMAGVGAVLKTPFVGSDTADYIIECFPELIKPYKDINGQIKLCKRLINDEGFWREITEKGYKIAQEKYSFEGAKEIIYKQLKDRNII